MVDTEGASPAVTRSNREVVSMRNLTVSVDDDVYRHCRVRAAELDTSVSALLRAFLRRLVSDTDREPTVPAREGERLLGFRRGELDEVLADLDAR